jgi:hypothetical protein
MKSEKISFFYTKKECGPGRGRTTDFLLKEFDLVLLKNIFSVSHCVSKCPFPREITDPFSLRYDHTMVQTTLNIALEPCNYNISFYILSVITTLFIKTKFYNIYHIHYLFSNSTEGI